MRLLSILGAYKNLGLLIMRLGLGFMFLYVHGLPKLTGGPDKWLALGQSIKFVGIQAVPIFWGCMAAIAESVGGLCILIGFLFRPACIFLLINLLVATTMHIRTGHGLLGAAHAIEDAIVFLALLLIGPGKYSIDRQ